MTAPQSSASFNPAREDFLAQMLHGLEASQNVHVLRTDQGTAVIDADHRPGSRVAVISGGGSGHEPAHAGFVGQGMLSAAVPGDIFSSPPVSAVLQAIRAVTGDAGCVLVIKNYTGDRLNFGLAAERARAEGYTVETVLISDDVALPDAAQRRGLAGTVLIHKLVGHLAWEGVPAAEIAQRAQRVADGLRTIGLALEPAHVPGEADPAEEKPAHPGPAGGAAPEAVARHAELGLGIHNEPGAHNVVVTSAAGAIADVLAGLQLDAPRDASSAEVAGSGGSEADQQLVVMLNDLGGCSAQEGLILAGALAEQVGAHRISRFLGPSRFMTSLDMHGFSVTVAPADAELIAALDTPTLAPGWRAPTVPGAGSAASAEAIAPATAAEPSAADVPATADGTIEAAVLAACRALVSETGPLDELDRRTGDGDAGTTFSAGAQTVIDAIDQGRLGFSDPSAALGAVAGLLESRMGGSSGVLLAILCAAAAHDLAQDSAHAEWASALGAGIEAVGFHGGAAEGDRTMLDALIPAHRALQEGASPRAAAQAARDGANATADLTARAGRSAYVPAEAQSGVQDAGAVAVAVFFEALAGQLE